ncbi:MAG: hypothetical protein HQL78_06510 [Magnetococcales bacterium]|nr:hypothetical protein [Magnetococcales bacterium]MBF0419803.1 hypothetical protein [Magnetococcales bacterium]
MIEPAHIVEMAMKKVEDERKSQAGLNQELLQEIQDTGGMFKQIILPKLQEIKSRLEKTNYLVRVYPVPFLETMDDLPRRVDFLLARIPEGLTMEIDMEEWLEKSGSRITFIANPQPGFLSISMTIFGKRYNGQRYANGDINKELVESLIFKVVNIVS